MLSGNTLPFIAGSGTGTNSVRVTLSSSDHQTFCAAGYTGSLQSGLAASSGTAQTTVGPISQPSSSSQCLITTSTGGVIAVAGVTVLNTSSAQHHVYQYGNSNTNPNGLGDTAPPSLSSWSHRQTPLRS